MSPLREPLKIFIGSGEASLLERKTLIYSLKKNCTRFPLDIFVFNGTHNSIERNNEKPFLADLPLEIKYQNVTEFSNYRWLIPQICKHEGKAVWIDSDTICLTDIAELFETDTADHDFLAKPSAYQKLGQKIESDLWGLSVALYDCSRTRFDFQIYFQEIAQGLYTYADLHQMTPKFLQHHPFKIGNLDPNWNSFDRFTSETKIIHYTNLHSQPWKFPNHTYGELWFQYFNEARKEGFITPQDIQHSIDRGAVRPDILEGNTSSLSKVVFGQSKYFLKRFAKKLLGA